LGAFYKATFLEGGFFTNSFVSVIDPERVISIRPILNKFKTKIDDYANIHSLKSGDNPILLIYKL
jgi:hypothetical protein